MTAAETIWANAEKAIVAGDFATLDRLLHAHPSLFREQQPKSSWLGGLAPDYSSADARTILAREHHFTSFEEFNQHRAALEAKDSAVAVFEAAVDAVVTGDEPGLSRHRRPRPWHHQRLLATPPPTTGSKVCNSVSPQSQSRSMSSCSV